jgi:predicted nucleotidyltransferase
MIDYELLRAETARHAYPPLFATISGAHLYGFPSADSDYDLRGVHILPAREAVGLLPKQETVEFSDVRNGVEMDLVTHDILKFFTMLSSGTAICWNNFIHRLLCRLRRNTTN